jgi:hypothetical protein
MKDYGALFMATEKTLMKAALFALCFVFLPFAVAIASNDAIIVA